MFSGLPPILLQNSRGRIDVNGDALIGADGIHSQVRALLYPLEGPPSISTSIRAARLRTSSTQAFTEASSRTSRCTSSTPARGRVVAGARTAPNTRWPRAAMSSAVARPMPDDAPVIRTTRLGPLLIGTPDAELLVARAAGRRASGLLKADRPKMFKIIFWRYDLRHAES